MLYLIIVSLIWAFSFGLIKTELVGLPSYLVSFIRLFISFVVFLPFFKLKIFKQIHLSIKLIFLGMIQFGLMYILYIYAYKFLKSYEIVLFTIFTPLFIIVFEEILSHKLSFKSFISPIIAIIGTSILVFKGLSTSNFWYGFLLIQGSNIAFAFGQIYYKRVQKQFKIRDSQLFSIIYFGAVLLTFIVVIISGDFVKIKYISLKQWEVLAYLGTIASGLCFYLWNKGARIVKAESLSVINNLKIPIAIFVSIFIFKETAEPIRLVIGTSIMLYALYLAERRINNNGS